MKRSTRQALIAIVIGLVVVSIGIIAAYIMNSQKIEKGYVAEINDLKNEITSNLKFVYKSTVPINAGDILEESDLTYTEEYYSLDLDNVINKEDVGKRILIDIGKNQIVLKNMIEPDYEFGLREMEYSLIRFNSNIVEEDMVDIRIVFPNGESYIVLSKKLLKNVDLGKNQCNLWLNEEEILKLSSAIVDAANYPSAYLCTAKYIDSGQEKSIVTYQPDEDVMLLIANNPNILTDAVEKLNLRERRELENRLSESLKEGKKLADESKETDSEEVINEEDENTEYQVEEEYGE